MSSENYSVMTSAAVAALKSYKEPPFVKHQWEELAMELFRMNDPLLLAMIRTEIEFIRDNDPSFMLH